MGKKVIHILHYNWLFIVVRCLEALLLCSEAQTGGGRELSAFNVARVRGVGCEMLSSVNKSSQEMLFISKHPLWELGYQVLVYRRELEIPLSSHSADRSTEVRLAFFLCLYGFFRCPFMLSWDQIRFPPQQTGLCAKRAACSLSPGVWERGHSS